ncbi:MAG TPA: diphosphomevalonate decarboxylase [Bacilli bacterium]|nr:diphosphomevalonate decarboxylase [Bacilli bacterium]
MTYIRANVNIALLKYWGKQNVELNLPYQTSISATSDVFYTDTKVEIVDSLTEDEVFLDGQKLSGIPYIRVVQHLNTLRKHFKQKAFVRVRSFNTVYIKAGFASSASAFAALTAAYTVAINKRVSKIELSRLARIGSGSAARSLHGGFVIWHKGVSHESSFAEQLPVSWPNFRMIFTLIETSEKKVSSRVGMQICVEKSPSFNNFVREGGHHVELMIDALLRNDLHAVGEIAEQNAELMYNVMLEAGLEYQTEATRKLIEKVKDIRKRKEIPVYYTFDAGPNLILLTEAEYVEDITKLLEGVRLEVSKVGGPFSVVKR